MKDLRISSTRTKYALPALGALAVLSALLSLCLGAAKKSIVLTNCDSSEQ